MNVRAVLARAAVDTLYLTIGLATSILAFVLWVTAVSVSLSLVLFIIGLPVILASAWAFRWTTELDRHNAALVLGSRLRAPYRDHGGERFLVRLGNTMRDPQTWKDLAWLVVHSVVGFGFGVAAISAIANVIGVALLPLWYWALPEGVDWGIWNVDTLPEAFLTMLLAIPLAALTVLLLRGMAIAEAWLAQGLLGAPAGRGRPASLPPRQPLPRPRAERDWSGVFANHAAITGVLGCTCTLIWGVTGADYFWPIWVWFGLLIPLSLHAAVRVGLDVAGDRRRAVAVQAAISVVIVGACVVLWMLTGFGYFWPFWTAFGLGVALLLHAFAGALWARLAPGREQELEERVDVLTRTRRGALDVQAAELRRIERDLHDGAQARLVALSMQLGRAEERVEDQPEVADLLRQARSEASAAIAELRDLARGIAPPVLADRGLAAAADSLGRRSPMPVTVEADIPRRPPPVLETGAYFVVAESLTNVAKHAGGAAAHVTLKLDHERLLVEIADEGPGGANEAGSGLTGLRHRVEALDGTLAITSPPGGGTAIRADFPLG